jgi:hypothetical protein
MNNYCNLIWELILNENFDKKLLIYLFEKYRNELLKYYNKSIELSNLKKNFSYSFLKSKILNLFNYYENIKIHDFERIDKNLTNNQIFNDEYFLILNIFIPFRYNNETFINIFKKLFQNIINNNTQYFNNCINTFKFYSSYKNDIFNILSVKI